MMGSCEIIITFLIYVIIGKWFIQLNSIYFILCFTHLLRFYLGIETCHIDERTYAAIYLGQCYLKLPSHVRRGSAALRRYTRGKVIIARAISREITINYIIHHPI